MTLIVSLLFLHYQTNLDYNNRPVAMACKIISDGKSNIFLEILI